MRRRAWCEQGAEEEASSGGCGTTSNTEGQSSQGQGGSLKYKGLRTYLVYNHDIFWVYGSCALNDVLLAYGEALVTAPEITQSTFSELVLMPTVKRQNRSIYMHALKSLKRVLCYTSQHKIWQALRGEWEA